MKTPKEKVLELLKSIETGEKGPVKHINPTKYIQHNLGCGDGLEGVGETLATLAHHHEPAKVYTVRVMQDGDYVFTHSQYNFFGPKVWFDIFRFEDGLIVEHWDNLCPLPEKRNPSNRSLTDGETAIKDRDKTEENRALIEGFVTDILMNRDLDKIGQYFDGENYIQHNENVGDGVSAIKEILMQTNQENSYLMFFHKIHKILAEGNFVLAITEGINRGDLTSFYDLFRIENGKIVEHWDVAEPILSRDNWKNQNGKFNFR